MKLKTGDWVKYHYKGVSDERIYMGYIIKIEVDDDSAKLFITRVIKGNKSNSHFNSQWLDMRYMEKLSESAPNIENINDLIDIALLTRDEDWFNELIAEKKNIIKTQQALTQLKMDL